MDEKLCPYCKTESREFETYVREAPPDKKKQEGIEKETMVKLYPCAHAFPQDSYEDYLENIKEIREYIDNFVTAKGYSEREEVEEKYKGTVKEYNEAVNACSSEVVFTSPTIKDFK